MIEQVKKEIEKVKEVSTIVSAKEVEQFRIEYLGKKGVLNKYFAEFKNIEPERKKEFGMVINQLKKVINEKLEDLRDSVKNTSTYSIYDDLSREGYPIETGAMHPLVSVRNKICSIFSQIGFTIAEGPEIEDDWYNFSALNFPKSHPARDMQDTFFVENKSETLLRTHTSSVQVRYMENNKPPMRILSPGRVFRNEDISARSHCIFHQIEGLYVNKKVSFAEMKQTLIYFTQSMFGKSKIRLRPSYFPFTEPSAEVDIYWGLETEIDKRITKGTGWLEIMGCGMIDPNVLENCGIDSTQYSGYAFGMGIERIAMLLYQIEDIRMFFENDFRFLSQFKQTN